MTCAIYGETNCHGERMCEWIDGWLRGRKRRREGARKSGGVGGLEGPYREVPVEPRGHASSSAQTIK
eukprot:5624081-Pleurochrysis_carterae.AAC.1